MARKRRDATVLPGATDVPGVERRLSNRGIVSYRCRWDESQPDGRRTQRSKTFATKKAAETHRRAMLHEIETGTYSPPSDLTLAAFVPRWLAFYATRRAPRSVVTRETALRRHILPALGGAKIARLSPLAIQEHYATLERSGLSTGTIVNAHEALRVCLSQAVRWGLIPRNVASLADPPTYRPPERTPWSAAQLQTFLDATAGDAKYGPLWLLATATGMRRSELLALRWDDLDLERGVLIVRRETTKTRSGVRPLLLPPPVAAALLSHQARQETRRHAAESVWIETGAVFDRGDGRPLPDRTVNNAFERAVRRAGLPPIHLHDLRHGRATTLFRAGVPVKTVSAMLGHASTSITLDLYTHTDLEDQRAALARVVALLDDAPDLPHR